MSDSCTQRNGWAASCRQYCVGFHCRRSSPVLLSGSFVVLVLLSHWWWGAMLLSFAHTQDSTRQIPFSRSVHLGSHCKFSTGQCSSSWTGHLHREHTHTPRNPSTSISHQSDMYSHSLHRQGQVLSWVWLKVWVWKSWWL